MFSAQIFQENTFLKTKPNFPLTGKCFSLTEKCFPLTNFLNGKQTHESLESVFPETTFRKTNTTKRKNTFLETKSNFSLTGKCFSLTGKCFPLTTFSNGKQIQESLKSDFSETTFQETNMALYYRGIKPYLQVYSEQVTLSFFLSVFIMTKYDCFIMVKYTIEALIFHCELAHWFFFICILVIKFCFWAICFVFFIWSNWRLNASSLLRNDKIERQKIIIKK